MLTDEKLEKLRVQMTQLADYEMVRLWNLCQKELERRDASWPQMKGYRATRSLSEEKMKLMESRGALTGR